MGPRLGDLVLEQTDVGDRVEAGIHLQDRQFEIGVRSLDTLRHVDEFAPMT
jgi:hypothetical protein